MCSRGNLTGTCAYGEERSALWMDLLRLYSHGCSWCLTEFFHAANIVLPNLCTEFDQLEGC